MLAPILLLIAGIAYLVSGALLLAEDSATWTALAIALLLTAAGVVAKEKPPPG